MIPGMFPAGAAAVASLAHLVAVDMVQAVGGSITIPTVQTGDVLVLQCFARDDSTTNVSFSAIAGWTTAAQGVLGSGLNGSSCHVKIAAASDSGTVVTGGTTGPTGAFRDVYKALVVYRGEIPVTGIAVGSANVEIRTGNPSAQTVTISGALAPLLVFGSYAVSSGISVTISPRAFTISGADAKDDEYQETLAAANCDAWLAWKAFSPADSLATPVIVDMDDEGSNALISFYLACT